MKKNIIIISCLIALAASPVFAKEIIKGKKQDIDITVKKVDLPCVQTAVEKRETAIISAFDGSSNAIKAALTARKDALKTAWAITDAKERRTAIKKAWDDFAVAIKAAKTQLRKDRNAAWSAFRKDIKTCKAIHAVAEEIGKGIENML